MRYKKDNRNTSQQTSWGRVAKWYGSAIEKEDSFHTTLILPNLVRLLSVKKRERILDLGCGTGFFSEEFARAGADVIGVDLSREFILSAQQRAKEQKLSILYHVGSADRLGMIADASIDTVLIVLAIQNMENYRAVFAECARVLKQAGKIVIVLNHPAFRIPKATSWEWDAKTGMQYRRVDSYLSEQRIAIQMHPGARSREITSSFHRPLQSYVSALRSVGMRISNLEEWISNKKSTSGPRAESENRARKEFPLFLYLEATK
mgnify:CR=1 FL=1